MTRPGDEEVELGLARRLAAVESLISTRPAWRLTLADDTTTRSVSVVSGSTFRGRAGGNRPLGALLAVGLVILLLVAYGLLGSGRGLAPQSQPASPTSSPPASATAAAGILRPAVEPRLLVPVRPATAWTVVEDQSDMLSLVHFLEDVGSGGYNVGLMIVQPHGVYDPANEAGPLPLPTDLITWIRQHPDLDAQEPTQLAVAGLPATAIDVTVTYPSTGPKGQTAQFIDIGPGPWNLESPSKKRIVLVQLPDHPLLIVYDSRPEFFDAAIGAFEAELARIQYEERGGSP
jgi:hypothetical protein